MTNRQSKWREKGVYCESRFPLSSWSSLSIRILGKVKPELREFLRHQPKTKVCVTNLCTRRRSGRNLCTSERKCLDAESFRHPRANERGSISALFEWRGIGGQRIAPMARAFCATLSVSTHCRSIPRACHAGAVDVLRPRGLGRVSRA